MAEYKYRKSLFKVLFYLKRNAKNQSIKRKRLQLAKWFLEAKLNKKAFTALKERRLRN